MTQEKLQELMMLDKCIKQLEVDRRMWQQATEFRSITLTTGNFSRELNYPFFEDFEALRSMALEYIDDRLRDLRYQFDSL